MTSDLRRSPRHPFFASAEITEHETGMRMSGRTSELSRHGCYLDMMNPLSSKSIVDIQIVHDGQTFQAKGHVVYSQSNVGMGATFDEMSPEHEKLLEQWMKSF
jgi:PilZ domain